MIKNLSPVIGPVLLACISIVVLFGIFMWFVYWIEEKPRILKVVLWLIGFALILSLLIAIGRTRTPYNTLVDVPISLITIALFIYSAWGVATGYMWWKDKHESISDAELRFVSLPGSEVEGKSSEDVGPTDSSRVLPADKQEVKGNLTMMNHETFKTIITQMQEDSLATLLEKNSGYSNADPLHNFRQAAKLKGETTLKAIGGMMAKHTVSIYDLINKASEEYVPEEVWFEKIQDHMNYLLFLWAAVEETVVEQNSFELSDDSCLHENPQDWSDVEVVTTEYKDDPNSKKPDLNSDEDLKELRMKLMFEETPEDEPRNAEELQEYNHAKFLTQVYSDQKENDDWEPPTSVMINKPSQE